MAKARRDLKYKAVQVKTDKAEVIVIASTGNLNIPNSAAKVTAFGAAGSALKQTNLDLAAALQSVSELQDLMIERHEDFNTKFDELCTAVEGETEGNAAKISSTGLEAYELGAGSPVGELPAPANLVATLGDHDGESDLSWNPVKGRGSYVVQYSTDSTAPDAWVQSLICTASKCTVPGLVTGQKYKFRVAAIGAAGQGAWSDPAHSLAA